MEASYNSILEVFKGERGKLDDKGQLNAVLERFLS